MFVLLREYTHGESHIAFPSYLTLQARTGWTPKTISKALKELESEGWLSRQHQFGGVTKYRLLRPKTTSQREAVQPATNTSAREAQYFPEGSPILPGGTPIKIEITKTEIKQNLERDALPVIPNEPVEKARAKKAVQVKPVKRPVRPRKTGNPSDPPRPGNKKQPAPVSASNSAPVVSDPTPLNDHQTLMAYLAVRTGQPILNGGAEGKAVKTILAAYTVEQAKEVLDHQLADSKWRGAVSWLSVQRAIADYFRRKQLTTNGENNNGTISNSAGFNWRSLVKNGPSIV